MKKLLISLAISTLSFSALAQIQVKDATINIDSRGDRLPTTDVTRLQERVRIGFTIDVNGLVEIVGLAATGAAYNNDWATVSSNNNTKDNVQLAFRNLYLRKVMGNVTLEAGALTPTVSIGAAGLAPSGWMDGVRVKAHSSIGDFKVTAGSLGDFKQPNAFERKFQGNFIEIEMERKVFDKIVTQTAADVYNGELNIREGVHVDMTALGDRVFKLFAEALYNVTKNAYNYEVGAETDLLKDLVKKYEGRVTLKLYYSDVSDKILGRSEQISAFYTYGPRFTAQLGGKLDQGGNANWYVRTAIGKQNRYDVGISLKIPLKKP